jgi:hypothetical protein
MSLEDKDFILYPKFRHNLWTNYEENPEVTILTVSNGDFEVPKNDSDRFMKIRTHCTGFNTVVTIAKRSGMAQSEVEELITPLIDAEILHLPFMNVEKISIENIIDTLKAAAKIWGEQLAETSITHDIFSGRATKPILSGWLLETYHYVKAYPSCLKAAVECSAEPLRHVVAEYMNQERGHEEFILLSLLKCGFTRDEVEESIPLVSTRTIIMLLKEVFEFEPLSVLIVASIIEAEGFDSRSVDILVKHLTVKHELPDDTFAPFFKHVSIDDQLGHQKLFENHVDLFGRINKLKLHDLVNMIHDIKHAFDLQKLEINDYYGKSGNYIPRQKVDFFAI